MGKCLPDAPSMTGKSRFPVSMSGLSGASKTARERGPPPSHVENARSHLPPGNEHRPARKGLSRCQLNANTGTQNARANTEVRRAEPAKSVNAKSVAVQNRR